MDRIKEFQEKELEILRKAVDMAEERSAKKEVNSPDVILDVAIDEYNAAEDELNNLMDEVDPVVETV